MSGIFNVYFDGVYWIGVILEENEKCCRVGKYIFGSEPTPNEIFEWARKGCPGLVMSDVVSGGETLREFEAKTNPKRMQREARRALENKTIGSYAQEKLQEALEAKKKTATLRSKVRRAMKAEERFVKKQLKRKKRKRGH